MSKQKVNIVIGRFQPFTLGHKELVVELYKKNNLPICILYIDNKKFDARHPFSNDIVEQCIDASFTPSEKSKYLSDTPYLPVRNANIVEIGKMLSENNIEPILLGCGTDRYEQYKKMANNPKYREQGELSDDFDVVLLERNESEISGTKVRQALKDDNVDSFNKMTTYHKILDKTHFNILYDTLREQLMTVKENLIDLSEYIYIYESEQAKKSDYMKFLITKYKDEDFPDQGFVGYIVQTKGWELIPSENQEKILEIVKNIYSKAKIAPFVGNYNGLSPYNSGCIAIRGNKSTTKPEVGITDDEFNELYQLGKYNGGGIFQKHRHDTMLKQNGKFIPSASEFEYLIVLALNYNYYCNINKENIQDFYNHYTGDNEINELILQYYKDHKEQIDDIIKPIIDNKQYFNSAYYKLKNSEKVSSWWVSAGNYNKTPNITPKTDIININGDCKISLKKFDPNKKSNNSQLMSGGYNEMLATIKTALKKSNVPDEKSKYLRYILNILENQNGFTKINQKMNISDIRNYIKNAPEEVMYTDEFKQLVRDFSRVNKEHNMLTKIIVDLCNSYPDFKYQLVYEAATGFSKYGGEESKNVPNYMMLWTDESSNKADSETLQKCKIYPIDEYIKKIVNNVSIIINFKGSGSKSWSVMRLLN